MMSNNSSTKLLILVFVSTLGLSFSSAAKANLFVQWIFAHQKQDCLTTCGETRGLKFPVPTGVDSELKKPSFFICVTETDKDWRAGFNKVGENSCTTAVDGKEYHGTKYYCYCTNNPRSKLFKK